MLLIKRLSAKHSIPLGANALHASLSYIERGDSLIKSLFLSRCTCMRTNTYPWFFFFLLCEVKTLLAHANGTQDSSPMAPAYRIYFPTYLLRFIFARQSLRFTSRRLAVVSELRLGEFYWVPSPRLPPSPRFHTIFRHSFIESFLPKLLTLNFAAYIINKRLCCYCKWKKYRIVRHKRHCRHSKVPWIVWVAIKSITNYLMFTDERFLHPGALLFDRAIAKFSVLTSFM